MTAQMQTEATNIKITYISWAEYCSRSDNTARELGGNSYMIYWGQLGSNPFTVLLKYFGQTLKTWRILRKERPGAVFVMSPPVFAVLAVYVYAALAHIPYVIDAHTAAFLHPRWRHFQWLQRLFCRHAATTIVTNDHLAQTVMAGKGHATIIRDVPIVYNFSEEFATNGKFSVAVVCSFNYDEPVAEIFRAAARLQDVQFYVTGNPKYLDPALAQAMPANVTLTGFLSDSAYGSLLSKANTVMTLTTRDHTMLRGAYEAVYQGTPVIISNWQILQDAFDTGAIYVDNTADSIVDAIREMQTKLADYRKGADALRAKKLRDWQTRKSEILGRLAKP